MEYYIDTEFMEGFRKPISWLPAIGFNKKRWFIELISIGIKAADGRSYYAISDEFNPRHANDWVKNNVIAKLPSRTMTVAVPDAAEPVPVDGFPTSPYATVGNPLYKSLRQIATDIFQFVCPISQASEYAGAGSLDEGAEAYLRVHPPRFYAYFADYDWVLFCTLYGTMMQLPRGFPRYCIDLKQELDSVVWSITRREWGAIPVEDLEPTLEAQFNKNIKMIKEMPHYPTQGAGEHTADDDADFNHRLHNFIQKLQRVSRI